MRRTPKVGAGTLEEIERISEEIGQDIKQDVENECVGCHGTGYVGPRAICSCGRMASFKNYYDKREVMLSSELVISRAYYYCPEYSWASEHLNEVARAWYGEGTDRAKNWVEARECDLLSDCVETVIRSIQSWRPADEEGREIRRKNLAYFANNKERMRYATFKAQGYHIGSGLVESACKTVVGQRLKQSGMRWSEPGAEALLHRPSGSSAEQPFCRSETVCPRNHLTYLEWGMHLRTR